MPVDLFQLRRGEGSIFRPLERAVSPAPALCGGCALAGAPQCQSYSHLFIEWLEGVT